MYLKPEEAPSWKGIIVMVYLALSTAGLRIIYAHNYSTLYLFPFEIKMLRWASLCTYWVNIQYKNDQVGLALIENKTGIITVNERFKLLSDEMKHFVILNLQIRISKNITVHECDKQTIIKCMKTFPDKKINFWRSELTKLLLNEPESIFCMDRIKNVISFL